MIVRARRKPIEQLPDYYRCCPELIQYIKETKDRVFLVDTASVYRSDFGCCYFCRNVIQGQLMMRIVDNPDYDVISVEAYDLDEGPVTGAVELDKGTQK